MYALLTENDGGSAWWSWILSNVVPVGSGTNLCGFLVAGHDVSMRLSNGKK